MVFDPLHLPHIVIICQPSVEVSLCAQVLICHLANLQHHNYIHVHSSDLCIAGFFLPLFVTSEVKVEMTAPVTGRVVPGDGPACESQFTVSFYIPEENQDNPPEPTDPDVFLEHRKEFTVYVR